MHNSATFRVHMPTCLNRYHQVPTLPYFSCCQLLMQDCQSSQGRCQTMGAAVAAAAEAAAHLLRGSTWTTGRARGC